MKRLKQYEYRIFGLAFFETLVENQQLNSLDTEQTNQSHSEID